MGVMVDAEVEDQVKGKTPASILQELATAAKLNPKFELISAEGAGTNLRFSMRCSLGDVTEAGEGATKKAAKQVSAWRVLSRIHSSGRRAEFGLLIGISEGRAGDLIDAINPDAPDQDGPAAATDGKTPVQLLNEFCTRQGWTLGAQFEGLDQKLSANNATIFVVKASVGNFSKIGEGKRIKDAKQAAAALLLDFLSSHPSVSPELAAETEIGTDVAPTPESAELLATFSRRLESRGLLPDRLDQIPQLFGVDWDGLESDKACKDVLIRICAKDKRFAEESPSFVVLPRPTAQNETQVMCLVVLVGSSGDDGSAWEESRTEVTHGSGVTEAAAVNEAAVNMLQFLVIDAEPLPPPPQTSDPAVVAAQDEEDQDAERLQIPAAVGPMAANAETDPAAVNTS